MAITDFLTGAEGRNNPRGAAPICEDLGSKGKAVELATTAGVEPERDFDVTTRVPLALLGTAVLPLIAVMRTLVAGFGTPGKRSPISKDAAVVILELLACVA